VHSRTTDERMDGRTDRRTGGRTNGRTDKTGPRVCGTYITCSITARLLTISRVSLSLSLSLSPRVYVGVHVCVGALATHRRRDERASLNRPHTTARNHSKPSVNTRGDGAEGTRSRRAKRAATYGVERLRGRGWNGISLVGTKSGGPRVSQQDVSAIVK